METTTFDLDTRDRQVVDLTDRAQRFCADTEADEGLLHVFAPHATAGLALIETGAGSDPDLVDTLERLLPRDDRYRHSHGSPGHGADHVLPAIVAPFLVIPVVDRSPALGTWQRIVLVDLNQDNPRRTVRLSLLAG